MVADDTYDLCLPILRDESLEDEDKTEKLEELLRNGTALSGKQLENAVLDSLWRYHNASSATPSTSPPPSRHTVIRRPSPAPWQVGRAPTPVASSPRIAPPPGFGVAPPAFTRAKSSTASPFTSPRPSPRLAVSSPYIPHSPSLNAYEFSESSPTPEIYGDYGSDTVDWLVNDDAGSNASSSFTGEGGMGGAATEWVQPHTVDMSPYDMLRSVLRDDRSDEELEKMLIANDYDLSATIMALVDSGGFGTSQPPVIMPEPGRTFLVGKSMSATFRPATPPGQAKSHILCKYWLSTGHCARADCRFSHDPSKTICKYWMTGNCLAGDTCMFSHDPSTLMARMVLEGGGAQSARTLQPSFQLSDFDSFPALQAAAVQHYQTLEPTALEQFYGTSGAVAPPPGLNPPPTFTPNPMGRAISGPTSRPGSRAATPSIPAVNDDEAFPSLGSAAAAKGAKKHHGKRGGHGHKDTAPSTLAELVRMSPAPSPPVSRKGLKTNKSFTGSRENSAAAQAVPAPEHVPWLETGESANKAYLKARAEAFKHGGLRNKFLQSAAQAWNRNDSRAAKALSLRGQAENDLMRKLHREAARVLYEERNKDVGPNAREIYVDLHGLHPEEAVSYLSQVLTAHQSSPRPIYAITGTGHHSKNGKDKVGKAIRGFLNEWRYAFREFSVPGDRNNVGGILGIDPSSWDKGLERGLVGDKAGEERAEGERVGESTKIRILRKGDAEAQGREGKGKG